MRRLIWALLFSVNLLCSSEIEEKLILDVVTEIHGIRRLIIDYLDVWPSTDLPNDYVIGHKREMRYDSKLHCLVTDDQNVDNPKIDDTQLRCLSCSNDGKYIAFSTTNINLIVLKSDELNKSFINFNNYNDVVSAICFLNTEYIASAFKDGVVKIFYIPDNECKNTIKLHSDEITKIAIDNNGEFLTSSSFDKTLKAYNLKDLTEKVFNGHTKKIMTFDFSLDGKYIASAGDEKTIKIWDFNTGICLQTLSNHRDTVLSLAYLDNNKIISGSQDRMVRLWDIALEESINMAGADDAINCLLNLPDTTSFIASWDGHVGLWDYQTKNLDKFKCNKGSRILNVVIPKSGKDIFVLTNENKIIILAFPLQYLSVL